MYLSDVRYIAEADIVTAAARDADAYAVAKRVRDRSVGRWMTGSLRLASYLNALVVALDWRRGGQ